MSKEQIEGMAKILCGMKNGCDGCMWDKVHCNERNCAEALYNAGYRKQEWISVEERLPQVTGKYICCTKDKSGNSYTLPADWSFEMKMWFGEFGEIKNMVTHWMPLPEAPKMKGGAE
jgi:hypothetical protein